MKLRLCAMVIAALAALGSSACGEVHYIEACKNAGTAQDCMSCCADSGYSDWSYNADYSPPCGCIE